MRVYELIDKLMDMPAGAQVYVETIKSIEEIEHVDMSDDESKMDLSFPAKFTKKVENGNYAIIIF